MNTARNNFHAAELKTTRIERSFADNGWGDITIIALTSTIAHVDDGSCCWFARIAELAEIGERPDTGDDYDRAQAYQAWCDSHTPLRATEIPRSAQKAAREFGNRELIDRF